RPNQQRASSCGGCECTRGFKMAGPPPDIAAPGCTQLPSSSTHVGCKATSCVAIGGPITRAQPKLAATPPLLPGFCSSSQSPLPLDFLAFPVVDMSMRACMQASSSASKLLKETCSYIMSLPREVDDLSGRLSYLTLTLGPDSPQAEITRSILGS
ncbi:hypothetical protein GW17_00021130, partial [Ensete ventricosum]